MDQKNYRKQITIGVIISFSLIFISALYFFISLHHILDNERNIVRIAENRFNIINEIRSNIDDVNDIKHHYFAKRDPALFIPYQLERKQTDELLRAISKVDEMYEVSPHVIETLRNEIVLFYDFDKDIAYAKTNNDTSAPYIHEQKNSYFQSD